MQIDGSVARWWTFAGGRVNHTLKYGLEVAEGWKVVADNFQLRIEGDGIGHECVGRLSADVVARLLGRPGHAPGRACAAARLPAVEL